MTESKPMTLDVRSTEYSYNWAKKYSRPMGIDYTDSSVEFFVEDAFKAGWKDCATWFYKNILELTGEEHTVAQLKKWHEREIGE